MAGTRRAVIVRSAAAIAAFAARGLRAQPEARPFVRWADLEINPARRGAFEAAATSHVEAVRRLEPGAVAFHAVAEAGNPGRIRVVEVYDDETAYRAHLQQPHFKAFLAATEGMTTGRRVHDARPIRLGAQARLTASPVVRVAEIEIVAARLQAYDAAAAEVNDDSIRLEPGVLTIYALALTDAPSQRRFFEIYADDAAYRSHIATPHFRKYVEATKDMIASRRLVETRPLFLHLRSPR